MKFSFSLKLIDNNFYQLTAAQAKKLSIDGELPKAGYEKRANPEVIKELVLLASNGEVMDISSANYSEGWIKEIGIFKATGRKIVWAIHLQGFKIIHK